jgi:hypothetical protein
VKKKYRKLKELNEFVKNYKALQISKNDVDDNHISQKEEISNVSSASCGRPDIFLNNGRSCEGCPYYENCRCNLKRLISDKKRKN